MNVQSEPAYEHAKVVMKVARRQRAFVWFPSTFLVLS